MQNGLKSMHPLFPNYYTAIERGVTIIVAYVKNQDKKKDPVKKKKTFGDIMMLWTDIFSVPSPDFHQQKTGVLLFTKLNCDIKPEVWGTSWESNSLKMNC